MKKYQLTLREETVSNYPVVSRVFKSLTPPERVKTLLATCEAFAKIEGMEATKPDALYYHAMSILNGKEPDYNRTMERPSQMTDRPTPFTSAGKTQDEDLIDRINILLDED